MKMIFVLTILSVAPLASTPSTTALRVQTLAMPASTTVVKTSLAWADKQNDTAGYYSYLAPQLPR